METPSLDRTQKEWLRAAMISLSQLPGVLMDHMDSEGDSMGFVKAGVGAWNAQDLSTPLMEAFATDVRLFWEGL